MLKGDPGAFPGAFIEFKISCKTEDGSYVAPKARPEPAAAEETTADADQDRFGEMMNEVNAHRRETEDRRPANNSMMAKPIATRTNTVVPATAATEESKSPFESQQTMPAAPAQGNIRAQSLVAVSQVTEEEP